MKFCIFVAICICLIIVGAAVPNKVRLEQLSNDGVFRFYSTDVVHSDLFTGVKDLGFSFIYMAHPRDAEMLRTLFRRIDGESITFYGAKDTRDILRMFSARGVARSQVGDINSTLAHTPRNTRFIVADGVRVNLQVARTGDRVTVGWPVILGSY